MSRNVILGPGSINANFKAAAEPVASGDVNRVESVSKGHKKCIWSEDEVKLTSNSVPQDVVNDPRQTPQYDSYFRQAVSSEDIYLQVNLCTSNLFR